MDTLLWRGLHLLRLLLLHPQQSLLLQSSSPHNSTHQSDLTVARLKKKGSTVPVQEL
jgi:hypothetical protein